MRLKRKRRSDKYTTRNEIRLVKGGKDYFDLLQSLIENATNYIQLQVYIFNNDETGRRVSDALKMAAQKKVLVYLIVDGFASQSLPNSFIEDMQKSGIQFRFFEPIFKSKKFYFGRRMHHKILVVDGIHAMTGGVNVADRYNDIDGIPAWLDFALYVKGEIVADLSKLCWQTWNGFPVRLPQYPWGKISVTNTIDDEQSKQVRMRRNDWVRRKNEISATYVSMLRTAKKDVTILCSYFLPGKVIRRQMKLAARRGVKIKVIASGTSDVMLSKNAERWMYDWLLRNGIQLYEYQKNILHGKLAVCDDTWMTIGSYNINDISAYASIEMNLDVNDDAFTTDVRTRLDHIIANDCIEITKEQLNKTKNIARQVIRWSSYQSVRLLFRLFTFYFKRGG
jgi:cardiolipin synthase